MKYQKYRWFRKGAFFRKIDRELPLCPFCAQRPDWLGMEICKGRGRDRVAFLACKRCGAELYSVNYGSVLNFDGNLRVLNAGKRNLYRLEENKVYHIADLNPQTSIPRYEEKGKMLYGIEELHKEMRLCLERKSEKKKRLSLGIGIALLWAIAIVVVLSVLFL